MVKHNVFFGMSPFSLVEIQEFPRVNPYLKNLSYNHLGKLKSNYTEQRLTTEAMYVKHNIEACS
jgi:hypothetical protein